MYQIVEQLYRRASIAQIWPLWRNQFIPVMVLDTNAVTSKTNSYTQIANTALECRFGLFKHQQLESGNA